MCGIAGIMTRNGSHPTDQIIGDFAKALEHRGPDGAGRYLLNDTAFVQTRLAIIDLAKGDQPFFVQNELDESPLALIANGEIYNYLELKQQLPDAVFKSQSDCELPLFLYQKYGIDYARHLRGMYSIAIHDPVKDRLILSRDPFGIKPLYYAFTPDGFIFSSEFQAFQKAKLLCPSINPEARNCLMHIQFSAGVETIMRGVYRVLPGETLVIEKAKITESIKLGALPQNAPAFIAVKDALKKLNAVLTESIGIHQRSDVPYGMFLSGGIDSSVILSLMARLNPEPVQAYTIGFSGTGAHDEREHARALAKASGADHHEIEYSEHEFWNTLPAITASMDDPAADYAVLPSYKLASEAKRDGLKVVLSGEGGDELFGGYGRYRRAMRHRWLGGRYMRQLGAFDGLGLLRNETFHWRKAYDAPVYDFPNSYTRLQKAQAHDCADWLPNDLLIKLDRCLMAHGVEGRVPFLDSKVADFAFGLPDDLKIKNGLGKWLLRKWLDQNFPEAKAFSKKRGFSVPVVEWISAKASTLAPLVANQQGVAEACHGDKVKTLFASLGSTVDKKCGQAAWHLLYYALWHNHHICRFASGGDVFDSLNNK
jgi:asparagine synthase (glutamine-hydrolysing)